MKQRELKEGDILQINTEIEHPFGGFFLVVTEPYKWGAQGYLLHSRDFEAVKFNGRAFLRVRNEDVEWVGVAKWLEFDKIEMEENDA